jgi:hypothetical protein
MQKRALHLLAVLAKEYVVLSSRIYPKSLKKKRNKMRFAGENYLMQSSHETMF